MTKIEIDELVKKYPLDVRIMPDTGKWSSQYDPVSADINYALVRHLRPSIVVEFGSRAGRCSRDMFRALLDNNKPFTFKTYELENEMRSIAQKNLDEEFGSGKIVVGGDITLATDIPDNIDYLFVDNYHDEKTTKWLFDVLLKKCVSGCVVQIHDIRVMGDYKFIYDANDSWGEMVYMQRLVDENKFPLKKLYWSWEDGGERSSSWWTYNPLTP